MSYISVSKFNQDIEADGAFTVQKIREDDLLGDGVLTVQEEAQLVSMDCVRLKELFGTQQEICLYLKDSDGFVVPLTNGTHTKYGVGCTGINFSNIRCGYNLT